MTIGAPCRWAIQAASGSVAADASEATSIFTGLAGMIIAAMRMTTVFHDRPRPPMRSARPVQVLITATPTAFSTK